MRINNKDRDRLGRVEYDLESSRFKSDKLELLTDILGSEFKEQMDRIVDDFLKEEKENKSSYTYKTHENLKKVRINQIKELLNQDLTLQEMEEKLFVLYQSLEEEFSNHTDFKYVEELVLTEDGLQTTYLFLKGLRK